MAEPTIKNGEEHFYPIIYEGNGKAQKVGKFVPFTDNLAVANSCIFDHASNAYVSRTPSSGGSTTKVTFSCWIKRDAASLGSTTYIMFTNDFSANGEVLQFDTSNRLVYYCMASSSYRWNYVSNRTFEDTSKWYNIVVARDTTDGTAGDRVKIYVDGDRITSWSTETTSGSSSAGFWNQTTYANIVGNSGNGSYIDGAGYLAEVNMIDGQALAPADFGITDTSTGRWIPVAYPTTLTTFTVTVVGGNPSNHPYHNVGSTNKYAIDGSTATADVTLTLQESGVYRFDQSDSSNSGHPLRFSTTANGTHGGGSEYTTGVTTNGTPGNTGAYTEITVASGAPTLYYYCTNHSAMGWTANTPDPFGTNGFKFKFQQSNALGDDTSGKGNDFTSSGLTTTDQTTDSPTQNHCIMDPNDETGSITMSEGNLKVTQGGAGDAIRGSLAPTSGKYYFEITATAVGADGNSIVGIQQKNVPIDSSTSLASVNAETFVYRDDGYIVNGGQSASGYTNWGATDVIGIAMDLDNHKLYFSVDGTYINSGNPANGTGSVFNLVQNTRYAPYIGFQGSSGFVFDVNTGQRAFNTSAPTGFVALQQDNLPETSKGISGLTWTKDRDGTSSWMCIDSSRIYSAEGVPAALNLNNTNKEYGQVDFTDGINKFLKGGFAVATKNNSYSYMNKSGNSNLSYCWVGNSGTTASNGSGSITSTVQANTTAGFSIVQYVGTGSSGSVGHGLSAAPDWMIFKDRDTDSTNWRVYHKSIGGITKYLVLNTTAAPATASMWGAPTTSVFIIGGSGYEVNESSKNYVAYCWHEVEGYSKFGKYVGNGVADGPFVYLGFKPALIIFKSNNTTNWYTHDGKRDKINPVKALVDINTTAADNSGYVSNGVDFLSNGFKVRQPTGYGYNYSGVETYYMAFARHPFVGDGTNPVTAR